MKRGMLAVAVVVVILLVGTVLAAEGDEDTTNWNLNFSSSLSSSADYIYAIALDSNSNVYTAGIADFGASYSDWWLKKFDSSGIEDTSGWNKTFTGSMDYYDAARSVAVDSQDNVYVVGNGANLTGTYSTNDLWIKKFKPDGTENVTAWNKNFTSNGSDIAYSVAVDSQDNVYVVGLGYDLVSDTSGNDWWVKRFDSDGNENTTSWNLTFSSSAPENYVEEPYAVTLDSEDNVYVVGRVGHYDWWIKKIDSSGTENTSSWNKTFTSSGATGVDIAYAVTVDTNDNVYVAGRGVNLVSGSSGDDWWIKKFGEDGTEDTTNWNKTFSAAGSDIAYSIMTDHNNNVYVAGRGWALVSGSSGYDWWIKKFDSAGSEDTSVWNKTIASSTSSNTVDIPRSVVVDSSNDVFVAGRGTHITSGTSSYDWWIKKFEGMPLTYLPNTTSFSAGSTDFSTVPNLFNVSSMRLTSTNTKVRWLADVNASEKDYDTYIEMGDRFVSINVTALDQTINGSAVVNMTGINCASFTLVFATGFYADVDSIISAGTSMATAANLGGDCTDSSICTSLSCTNNVLTFTAQHFDGFGGENGDNNVPEFSTWLMLIVAMGLVVAGITRVRKR